MGSIPYSDSQELPLVLARQAVRRYSVSIEWSRKKQLTKCSGGLVKYFWWAVSSCGWGRGQTNFWIRRMLLLAVLGPPAHS